MEIRKAYPRIGYCRTCKQKSNRHNYYVVETKGVMGILRRMRGGGNVK